MLGRLLVDEWNSTCDRIDVEPFTCSPTAFLGFIPFSVLLYFAAVILYWFFPLLSLVMITIMLSVSIFELSYLDFVDFLFPHKQGENIIGVIRPKSEVTQRVVVSAHLDSAYEFNLFYYLKNAAVPILAIAILGLVITFGGSLVKTIAYGSGTDNAQVFTVIGIIMVVLSPVVGLLLFFHTYRPVSGAMDNMAGIAVVSGLGKYLNEARSNGNCYPEQTEVILLATSSEEAGLRGAKRYVIKHLTEMKETPTYGLFLDCIYDEKFLTVAKREIFTRATHDHDLVRMAKEVAAIHRWPIAAKVIPIGATDASAFSLRGISSICLLCQDISRLVPNYHTRNDTYEYIRPESLSVSLQLVIDMIERIDRN
jgi:hypothetical protein